MNKEIKLTWRIEAGSPSLNIQYVLHADIASMSFSFRAPTESWHYWLATGVDYHADSPQYNEHNLTQGGCNLRPSKNCYCDGTSLGADSLWKKFIESKLDESVIWEELEEWMSTRFPTAK